MFWHFALPALTVFLFLIGVRKQRDDKHWRLSYNKLESQLKRHNAGTDDLMFSGLNLGVNKILIVGVMGACIGAVSMLLLTGKVSFAPVGFVGGFLAPKVWIDWKMNTRRQLFQNQIETALNLMAAALRAGANETQAWEQAAMGASPPVRDVLEYVIRLNRSGRSLTVSMEEAVKRTDSRDLKIMAAATALCLQTGGDLAGVYDRLGETIREKQAYKTQVEGLMAEGKMSANFLAIIPFAFIALFRQLSPQYMEPLFSDLTGSVVFIVCSAMVLIGWLILRKMFGVDY